MKLIKSQTVWRFLTDFWTIALFILIIVNLFFTDRVGRILSPMSTIYVAILGLYVGTKEFKRWRNSGFQKRLGELYIALWTTLLFVFIILSIYRPGKYEISPEIVVTYLAVVSIFAIGKESKHVYNKHRK